jgi:NAD(P)-dependent dehydrogenase (short-subunit alcohol dehydrogenase family)
MSGRLAGQVAWISGGASGIGAATAKLFAREGALVTIADVQPREGQRLASEITAAGGHALFSACDVTSSDQVESSLESAAAVGGGLQVIVNCAGIVQVGQLHEYDESDWDRLMAVNVKSIFFSVKYGFPYLRANASSYIVNVGSISSFVGQAATPAYTTSKGAVLSLTRSIALDYASYGVRCNCVCPGITDTPMLREHLGSTPKGDELLRQRVRRVPMNRALQPGEIARTILYLACEDSAGVTGTTVVVDGGYLAAAEWNADSG